MSSVTRDGTTEPVSRDKILRREWGQGNIHFLCKVDHEQDWRHDLAYIHTYIQVTGSEGQEGANGVEGGTGIGGGNGDGNGDVNGHGDGDGAGT